MHLLAFQYSNRDVMLCPSPIDPPPCLPYQGSILRQHPPRPSSPRHVRSTMCRPDGLFSVGLPRIWTLHMNRIVGHLLFLQHLLHPFASIHCVCFDLSTHRWCVRSVGQNDLSICDEVSASEKDDKAIVNRRSVRDSGSLRASSTRSSVSLVIVSIIIINILKSASFDKHQARPFSFTKQQRRNQ